MIYECIVNGREDVLDIVLLIFFLESLIFPVVKKTTLIKSVRICGVEVFNEYGFGQIRVICGQVIIDAAIHSKAFKFQPQRIRFFFTLLYPGFLYT